MPNLPSAEKRWIPDSKVRDFLLGDRTDKHRERKTFFEGYGFRREQWQTLRSALMAMPVDDAVEVRNDHDGVTYKVVGPLETPNRCPAKVAVFWLIRLDDARPQFTSAVPKGAWR